MSKTFNKKLFQKMFKSQYFVEGLISIGLIVAGMIFHNQTYEFPIASYAEAYYSVFYERVIIFVVLPIFIIINSRYLSYYWQPQILLRFGSKSEWWKSIVRYLLLCCIVFTIFVQIIVYLQILIFQVPPLISSDPLVMFYSLISFFLVCAITGMNYLFAGYMTKNKTAAFLYAYIFPIIDLILFFVRSKLQIMIGYMYTPMKSNATLFSSICAIIYLTFLFAVIYILYKSIITSQRKELYFFG